MFLEIHCMTSEMMIRSNEHYRDAVLDPLVRLNVPLFERKNVTPQLTYGDVSSIVIDPACVYHSVSSFIIPII